MYWLCDGLPWSRFAPASLVYGLRDCTLYPYLFNGVTPLHWSIHQHNAPMTRYLLDSKVDLNDCGFEHGKLRSEWKYNYISTAIHHSNWKALRMLLQTQCPLPNGFNVRLAYLARLCQIGHEANRPDFCIACTSYRTESSD